MANNADKQSKSEEKASELGNTLRMARMKLGMKPNEVAKVLHLTTDMVKYLEGGAYEYSRKHVFYRGYIRAYATLLGLPSDDIVKIYNEVIDHNGMTIDLSEVQIERYKHSSLVVNNIRWLSYVLLFSAIFFVGVWWYKQGTSTIGEETLIIDNITEVKI